jgi:hypothetical protein
MPLDSSNTSDILDRWYSLPKMNKVIALALIAKAS